MTSAFLCLLFFLISIGIIIFNVIRYFIVKFILKRLPPYFSFPKITITSLSLSLVIFVLASIVPYMAQQSDYYLVSFYTTNIVLYNKYSDEYTTAAQKQIAEYEKAKSEMAKTATSIQLQFWSQQIDTVGNQMTEKIRWFKERVMEQEIKINEANARIDLRPKNKWFFGLE